MKTCLKSLLPLMVILFSLSGCSKDNDVKNPTIYTFTYSASDISGTTIDAYLLEYNKSGEVIATNIDDGCKNGSYATFTAKTNAVKVKVYMIATKKSTNSTIKKWVNNVFYLTEESNTSIAITNSTLVSSIEP